MSVMENISSHIHDTTTYLKALPSEVKCSDCHQMVSVPRSTFNWTCLKCTCSNDFDMSICTSCQQAKPSISNDYKVVCPCNKVNNVSTSNAMQNLKDAGLHVKNAVVAAKDIVQEKYTQMKGDTSKKTSDDASTMESGDKSTKKSDDTINKDHEPWQHDYSPMFTHPITDQNPSTINQHPSIVSQNPSIVSQNPSTINTIPSTINTIPSTINTTPSTINTIPSTINTIPSTINTIPSTINTTPSTINTIPSTMDTNPSMKPNITEMNPNPSSLNYPPTTNK